MCTSYVLYTDKTYIGMNFDLSDRPIKLTTKGMGPLLVSQKEGDRFLPAFGINRAGTFINLLMVEPTPAGVYRRGKGCIHIIKLFDAILRAKIDPRELGAYLQDKTIVNVPQISVHSMVACPERCAMAIEPGRSNIPFDEETNDFLVLTNFALSDFVGQDTQDITGPGADRYKTCTRLLNEFKEDFGVEHGLSILEQTAQSTGDYPTLISILAIPEDGIVHVVTKRNFDRRYLVDFADNTIRTGKGFEQSNQRGLSKGILLSDLEQW